MNAPGYFSLCRVCHQPARAVGIGHGSGCGYVQCVSNHTSMAIKPITWEFTLNDPGMGIGLVHYGFFQEGMNVHFIKYLWSGGVERWPDEAPTIINPRVYKLAKLIYTRGRIGHSGQLAR